MSVDVTEDWFWEGNVVAALALHLSSTGWSVGRIANTHSKEQGVDLKAMRSGLELLVEVKGFPSSIYRDPKRAGEFKPTNPTNQEQQWYSHALLKAMRLQEKHPSALVAIAFPDFPRYRSLFEDTKTGLRKLGVAVFFVAQNGNVVCDGL